MPQRRDTGQRGEPQSPAATRPAVGTRAPLRAADLRGIAQLATLATTGVTDIVEGVHRSVLRTMGLPVGRREGRTSGLTGLVYGSVRMISRVAGGSIERALRGAQMLQPIHDPDAPESERREALLAALNGVLGDRLVAANSPFATAMSIRLNGQALLRSAASHASTPVVSHPPTNPSARLLLMIHGLCMNDLQWRKTPADSGGDNCEALAQTLNCTPLYLRYNTGLHVSQNGHELARQLESLSRHWPMPITELNVLAHSMGGLVIRSALRSATKAGHHWPAMLKNVVFLGTPHHSAPLERAGNWVDVLLGATPWSAPFAKLGQLRSAGITDLRHGFVTDEDWRGQDRFRRTPERRVHVPLPAEIACFTIAATTASKRSRLADRLIGDGLVPVDSALGRHANPERCLAFDAESSWIAYQTNHMALLHDAAVFRQIHHWLAPNTARHRAA